MIPPAALVGLLLASRAAARPIEIRVDPRTELLAAVSVLAARGEPEQPVWYPALRDDGSAYARALQQRVDTLADDPAVRDYRALKPLGLDAVTGLGLVLQTFTPRLEFDAARVPPHLSDEFSLDGKPRRYAQLMRFAGELQRFGARAKLQEFLADPQRRYVRGLERQVRQDLRGRDYEAEFEQYAGIDVDLRYTLYLCPLFNSFASTTQKDGRASVVVAFLGPASPGDPVRFHYSGIERKIWQELAHDALDGLAEQHRAEIERSASLFDPKVDRCQSWLNCVREHAARAVSYRIMQLHRRDATAHGSPAQSEEGMDPVTRLMAASLVEYENNRSRYADLAAFYPRMLQALTSEAARRATN